MRITFFWFFLFFSLNVSAQVLKFEQISEPVYVDYSFQELNGNYLFGGSKKYTVPGNFPLQLFETDGTSGGTILLNNTFGGGLKTGFLEGVTSGKLNGEIYYNGFDSVHGTALWKTDGTHSGTMFLKDLNPSDKVGGGCFYFTALQDKLIFSCSDSFNTYGVFTTDGTSDGTSKLKDIHLKHSSESSNFLTYKSRVYFMVVNQNFETEIWVTDGTVRGTEKFIDLESSFGIKKRGSFTGYVFEDELYFISGGYLFKTNGTSAGTRMLLDSPGQFIDLAEEELNSFLPRYFLPMNGKLYFQYCTDLRLGAELWVTDGTKDGTKMLKDITPGEAGRVQPNMAVLNDSKIIFSTSEYEEGNTQGTGLGLWVTDGTEQGTRFLKDLDNQPAYPRFSSQPAKFFIEYKGELYFYALHDSQTKYCLWKTNGTPSGTAVVMDSSMNIQNTPILYNNRMYWVDHFGPSSKGVLWQSEGDSASTMVIKPMGDTNSSVDINLNFGQYLIVNNTLVFRASYGDWQQELWALTTTPLVDKSTANDNFEFTIYPNPASTILKVKSDEQNIEMRLLDIQGRELQRKIGDEIDVSTLANGIFILQVKTSNDISSRTFQIKR